MLGCCEYGDWIRFRREERRKVERRKSFEVLMDAVWANDISAAIKVLTKDPSLVYGDGHFNFDTPEGKSTLTIRCAEMSGFESMAQVLRGFAAV